MDRLLSYFPQFYFTLFMEAEVPANESSRERKVLDFSLSWSECSLEQKSTGAKVLSVDFSLPGAKVQWN